MNPRRPLMRGCLVACVAGLLWTVVVCREAEAAAFVVTTLADSGAGSLRQAILDANASAGTHTITSVVAGEIVLLSDLPPLTRNGITIDGGDTITLNGFNATSIAAGLTINAANCVVTRLTIVNFTGNGSTTGFGIRISGAGAQNNHVYGCRIGNDGATARPNTAGVFVDNQASLNEIGGTFAANRNILSGNSFAGVWIRGTGPGSGPNLNAVRGNYIGLDATGTVQIANGVYGVLIEGGAYDNLVGGTAAVASNVIAGSGTCGVCVHGEGTTGNQIRRNAIYDSGTSGISLDEGGNTDLLAPRITAINVAGGNVYGRAVARAEVELFADFGAEGQIYLSTVIASDFGFFDADAFLTPYLGLGMNVTATQTDIMGNTSGFSEPFAITTVTHRLTTQTLGAGRMEPPAGQRVYTEGTRVLCVAMPEAGWVFSRWEGSLTGTSNPAVVVMGANRFVRAVFVADPNATAVLQGVIKDTSTGQPVSRAAVVARSGTGGVFRTAVNVLGRYQITGLPAGAYALSVFTRSYQMSRRAVTLSNGTVRTENFGLDRRVDKPDIAGSVSEEASGLSVSGVRVTAYLNNEICAETYTDAWGIYALFLESKSGDANVVVQFQGEGFDLDRTEVETLPDSTTSLDKELSLKTALPGTMTGTVRDASSALALSDTQVRATLTGIGFQASTNVSGLYAFPSLEAGTYSVHFARQGYQSADRSATVSAGAAATQLDATLQKDAAPPSSNGGGGCGSVYTSRSGGNLGAMFLLVLGLVIVAAMRVRALLGRTRPLANGHMV